MKRLGLCGILLCAGSPLLSQSAASVADAPQTVSQATTSIRIPVKQVGGTAKREPAGTVLTDPSNWWLHSRGKSTCYFFRDVHEYETFVTVGPDPNGTRVSVQRLQLNFMIAHERGSNVCNNTNWCPKTIEEFNLRCRSPRGVSARMDHQGWYAQTNEAQW